MTDSNIDLNNLDSYKDAIDKLGIGNLVKLVLADTTVELSYIVFKKDENSVMRVLIMLMIIAFIYLDNNDPKLSKNKKKDVIQIEKLFVKNYMRIVMRMKMKILHWLMKRLSKKKGDN